MKQKVWTIGEQLLSYWDVSKLTRISSIKTLDLLTSYLFIVYPDLSFSTKDDEDNFT